MKKQIIILLSILAMIPISNQCYSQATVANIGGNVRVNGYFLGWDNTGTSGSLEIRNDFQNPINFLTNNGGKRMKIQSDGNIILGAYGVGGSNVTAYNHVLQFVDGNTSFYHQFCNTNTSSLPTSAADGLMIGLTYNSGSFKSDAELISQQNGADMNFYTSNSSSPTNRMMITSAGDVGIGTTPGARFHVDFTNSASAVANYSSLVTTNVSGTSNTNYGFWSVLTSTGSSSTNYGIASLVSSTSSDVGIGG